jgi:hypothetical protein
VSKNDVLDSHAVEQTSQICKRQPICERSRSRLLFAIATNFLGLWLVCRTPTEAFYRIAYLLMALIAIALLWKGAHGLGS